MKRVSFFIAFLSLTLGLSPAVKSAEIFVATNGSETAPYDTVETALQSIQGAIDVSTAGDTIRIIGGTYVENLTVPHSLTLKGDGLTRTVIDGGGAGSCIIVTAGTLTLESCLMTNGIATNGGGLLLDEANAVVTACRFYKCSAGRGGAIYADTGVLTMTDCVVEMCIATSSGTGDGKGGGVYILFSTDESRIADSAFFSTQALYGAAMRFWQAEALVERCQFFYNRAFGDMIDIREVSDVDFVDCLFHNNESLTSSTLAYYSSLGNTCYLTMTENRSFGKAAVLYADLFSRYGLWNSAFQRNDIDDLEIPSDSDVEGCVFSTVPLGFEQQFTATNEAFTVSDDGNYYLSPDQATAKAFIAAGSTNCPATIDDLSRKVFVTGPAPAPTPHAGYGYPLNAEGQVVITPTPPTWTVAVGGRPYLNYTLEEADDAAFATNVSSNEISALSAATSAVTVGASQGNSRFFRLHGREPIGNQVTINIDDGTDPIEDIRVDIVASSDLNWVASAETDAGGVASFRLIPDGDYTIYAAATSLTYVPLFLGNTEDSQAATTFTLGAGSNMFTGTISLFENNTITGTVTSNTVALEGALVSIYDSNDLFVKESTTDATGVYSVGGLSDGDYKVLAQKSPTHVFKLHQEKPDFATADLVTLAGAGTENISFDLVAKPSISGTVTLSDSGNTEDIVVVVYDASTFEEITFAYCDADGDYTVYAVAGDYVLTAGEDSNYVVGFTNSLELTGTGLTDIDFALEPGGTISGTVVDDDDFGIANLYVDFFILDGLNLVYVDTAITDSQGVYLSPNLAANDYFVQVDGTPAHVSEWYDNVTNADDATSVKVFQHQSTDDINFQLSTAP